ncbi:MAG TPA: lasso peptide biosynthesis B2 protein [Thermoanaerobaculia bacterium]|nr:lasso peptide biosynthesis B2 protein [Thermoanaerobaculia bacterium]
MILLGLEALVRLALARLMLVFLPLERVLERPARPRTRGAGGTPALLDVRRAIAAAARRAPWRCRCLEQSIAAQGMLRARGIPATLYLGVEKHGDALRAHAWVRSGDVFVTGGDDSSRFEVVYCTSTVARPATPIVSSPSSRTSSCKSAAFEASGISSTSSFAPTDN